MSVSVGAVVCGELNMTRCFVGTGVPIYVVVSSPTEVTLHSRYWRHKRAIASPRHRPQHTLSDLMEIGRSCTGRPVLYYADDGMLLVVSRNRELLERHFRFLMPDPEMIEDLTDKTRFASLSAQLDLHTPKTVNSAEISSADEILGHFTLPCVFKPNSHVRWFLSPIMQQAGQGPQKALTATTPQQVHDLYEALRQQTEGFVAQEYVEGGEDCIYSYHAYYDRNSVPLAEYVGRKFRTYPKGSGVSTYLGLTREPAVIEIGREVLAKLKFVGPVKIDFKKDIRRNRFYVLEINPRFSLWNYLGAVSGINIPLVAHMDQQGQACRPDGEYRTDIRWLSFGNDFRSFVRYYRPDGDMTWAQWLWSLRGRKVYDVFSWDDPMPYMACLSQYVMAFARKLSRRLARWRSARPASVLQSDPQALVRGKQA